VCGIVGFIGTQGTSSEDILNAMLAAIAHRGPDDKGVWIEDDIAIGQVRLSILDLSTRGHQPFLTGDGKGILSYNGEVYNYRELRAELEQRGIAFISRTDTEVVLYALHEWGPEQAISRFNGMFAFAYYDLRDRSLWLVGHAVNSVTQRKSIHYIYSWNTISIVTEHSAWTTRT